MYSIVTDKLRVPVDALKDHMGTVELMIGTAISDAMPRPLSVRI